MRVINKSNVFALDHPNTNNHCYHMHLLTDEMQNKSFSFILFFFSAITSCQYSLTLACGFNSVNTVLAHVKPKKVFGYKGDSCQI